MAATNLSSNWKQLQKSLQSERKSRTHDQSERHSQAARSHSRSEKRASGSFDPSHEPAVADASTVATVGRDEVRAEQDAATGSAEDRAMNNRDVGKYIALDCEMVGVGPKPEDTSQLARVSMVDYHGKVVYDTYVLPVEPVTDYRTQFSGILPRHLKAPAARTFDEVRDKVSQLLKGRIVVGHALRNDFSALQLTHPRAEWRDTARHPPYRRIAMGWSPSLKMLAKEVLGLEIQTGSHSSVEDAQATMLLFRKDRQLFEMESLKRFPPTAQKHGLGDSGNSTQTKAQQSGKTRSKTSSRQGKKGKGKRRKRKT